MKKDFIIMMPPPNVSGSLHMGHALNFFLQDFLGRTAQILLQQNTYLLPGLDHGGISSQYSALKNINNLDKINEEEKLNIIESFTDNAKINILKQMEAFNLISDSIYLKYTMSEEHIKLVNKSFVKLYNRGLIFEDERIIYWDHQMKTSLSSLEVVHKKIHETLYFIKYKLTEKDTYVTVATTRPETMFGDVALAVGKKNQHLVGKKVLIPFTNKEIPIIYHDEVQEDFGSGILKVTPAHDEIDFEIAKKYKLPVINILNEKLLLNHLVPEKYQGLNTTEGRKALLEDLKIYGLWEKEEPINHGVMFGDKSGVRIETIVKKQWYLDLSNSAKKALKLLEAGEFKIFPSHWESTYKNWLENLQPWCISREILWGHPIPVWRTHNRKKIIVATTEKEALLQSNGEKIIRDNFLLDTWFSSALWPLVYKHTEKNFYPTSVLVTAYDIIFFWVARMVMMCLEVDGSLPFKNVLIHNLVRDGVGEKMSKTKGNVQDPLDIIGEYGNSDTLRYGLLSKITPRGQIRFGEQDLDNSKKLMTKLKNAVCFLKSSYCKEDFIYIASITDFQVENEICIYFLNKLNEMQLESIFKDFNIYKYFHNLYNFFWHDYCDWFIEMSKKQLENDNIKFTLILIMKKILGLFYGVFPSLTKELYEDLFSSDIKYSYTHINIKFNSQKAEKVKDLIFLVEQIRSFHKLAICKVMVNPFTFNLINENKIYEALRINSQTDFTNEKFLKIRGRKIYISQIDFEKLKGILEKKNIEIEILKNRIKQEIPPDNVLKEMKTRLALLKEEIEVLHLF
jgi:valyl-tRNA synthetase